MRITILVAFLLFGTNILIAQEKFKVEERDTDYWMIIFDFVDESGNLIRTLDTSKYFPISLNDESYNYFAIVQFREIFGLYAIDANENILFEVYNRSYGMPEPDYLREDRIRIIDDEEKIGYANGRGEIIIKPQFEFATSFHNGKAIIGKGCEKICLDKNVKEADSIRHLIDYDEYGYINQEGEIIDWYECTLEEMIEEIKWKSDY